MPGLDEAESGKSWAWNSASSHSSAAACVILDLSLSVMNSLRADARTVNDKDTEEPEYQVRFVFRERVSGTLFPMVFEGELRFEELYKWGDDYAYIGNNRPVRLQMVASQPDGFRDPPRRKRCCTFRSAMLNSAANSLSFAGTLRERRQRDRSANQCPSRAGEGLPAMPRGLPRKRG